ncbi:plasmid replication initiator TrfA [Polaromonas hydrogenivorans]|uniref:Plasmid replication initiator TrfA n=1 Tax=Polaromonas hydrogenivorans TaxID=335476 RepID=A0AAU7M0F5_9BURK
MDSAPKTVNPSIASRVEKAQRNAYLSTRGIVLSIPFQMDLLFPNIVAERDDLRHIPNDYARSSLFTARNKTQPRKTLMHEKLFHYNEFVSLLYTGIELRAESDEIVWLQILNYGQSVPFGEPFQFSVKDLVKDVNWSRNGRNYDRARECISRLKANEVLALNTKAYGTSGSISLIQNYTTVNDSDGKPTQYRVWIDPNLIVLFAGNTFTSHRWKIYRDLSPVARRLTDYIESHKHPYPLSLEKFRQMCGSIDSSVTSWRQTVKRACAEVQQAKIAAMVTLNKTDQIYCLRE